MRVNFRPNVKVHSPRPGSAVPQRRSGHECCQGFSNSERVEVDVPRLVLCLVASVSVRSNRPSAFAGIAFFGGWILFFHGSIPSCRFRSIQIPVRLDDGYRRKCRWRSSVRKSIAREIRNSRDLKRSNPNRSSPTNRRPRNRPIEVGRSKAITNPKLARSKNYRPLTRNRPPLNYPSPSLTDIRRSELFPENVRVISHLTEGGLRLLG